MIPARPSGTFPRQLPLRSSVLVWLAAMASVAVMAGCGSAGAHPSASGSSQTSDPSLSASPAEAEPSSAPPIAPSASSSPAKASASTGPQTSKYRYVYPIVGKSSYARTHHDYPASDMMAACGLQIRAVIDGVILEVSLVDRFDKAHPDGALKGGLFVSLLGDDGVRYYQAHMSKVMSGISAGARVTAGQQIGLVGTTGNSGACHVHFGISPPCLRTGDWWTRRGVVFPWSYLDSWKAGGTKSPASEVAAWKAKNGCRTTAPAA